MARLIAGLPVKKIEIERVCGTHDGEVCVNKGINRKALTIVHGNGQTSPSFTAFNSKKASKVFGAMFEEIQKRTRRLQKAEPSRFVNGVVRPDFVLTKVAQLKACRSQQVPGQ